MEKVKLVVQHREAAGSRGARRLRREGRVPGVLYGHGNPATLLSVEPAALRAALTTEAGTHAVLEVVFEDQKKVHRAIVKEMELDRVKHTVTHIDLEEVRLDQVVEVEVEIRYEGDAAGIKAGGILDESLREVTVKGLVTEIPQRLTLDITQLGIGDTLHVSDIVPPEGIEVLDDPELLLCSILLPRAAEVEEEAEEGVEEEAEEAAAEPEVIGKHKEEEAE
jgi:large subunit ribosomal protein L25